MCSHFAVKSKPIKCILMIRTRSRFKLLVLNCSSSITSTGRRPGTFSPDGDQLHPLACDELQRFVHVCNLMKTHFPSVWLG